MEEVDEQILRVCEDLQCSFIGSDLASLDSMSRENVFEFLTRCLWLISPATKTSIPSYKLPPNIFQRFQSATVLANSLKAHNIGRNVGYQTLLYGSTAELRQIFISIAEKIPKQTFSQVKERDLLSSVRDLLSYESVWMPKYFRHLLWAGKPCWLQPDDKPDILSIASTSELAKSFDVAFSDSRDALISIIVCSESTSRFKRIRSKPSVAAKPRIAQIKPPEGGVQKASEEDHTSVSIFAHKRNEIAEATSSTAVKQELINNLQTSITDGRSRNASIEESIVFKDCEVVALLTGEATIKEKLLAFVEGSKNNMKKLELEFHKCRDQLLHALEDLSAGNLHQEHRYHERFLKCRQKLNSVRAQIKRRSEMAEKKEAFLKKEKTNVLDRNTIIQLIKEYTANMRMLDNQIEKLAADNKSVQRELEWVTQTLYRSFSPIEETLFECAEDRKGERAYKLFGRLHAGCFSSIEAIRRNGVISRQNQELLDLIECEEQHQYGLQLERICEDLKDVVEENNRLEQSLIK